MGTLSRATAVPPPPPGSALSPQALASLQQAQALAGGGPLVQARNLAVMTGVNAGILSVMKRIRGKEDVESSMVAGFGSGAAFSLVSGMGGANLATNAVSSGLVIALIEGAVFKVGEKFLKPDPPSVDPSYTRISSMLSNLGLQQYEKNFKQGVLTDTTLPLLDNRQ